MNEKPNLVSHFFLSIADGLGIPQTWRSEESRQHAGRDLQVRGAGSHLEELVLLLPVLHSG